MNYEKSKTNGRGNQKNANYAVQPKIEIEKGGFVVVVNFFFFFFFPAQQFWKSSCCGLRKNRSHNILIFFSCLEVIVDCSRVRYGINYLMP